VTLGAAQLAGKSGGGVPGMAQPEAPRVLMDDDQRNFKMLASFINSYKGKLMISENLSIPSKSGGQAFEKAEK
jgi:hypothetical protein